MTSKRLSSSSSTYSLTCLIKCSFIARRTAVARERMRYSSSMKAIPSKHSITRLRLTDNRWWCPGSSTILIERSRTHRPFIISNSKLSSITLFRLPWRSRSLRQPRASTRGSKIVKFCRTKSFVKAGKESLRTRALSRVTPHLAATLSTNKSLTQMF